MILSMLRSICVEALNRSIYGVVRDYWRPISRQKQSDQPRLMNKSEVAIMFGVSKQTIDRWVNDGKLPEPRRSLFSTQWQYEQLAGLVKFRSTRQKKPVVLTE